MGFGFFFFFFFFGDLVLSEEKTEVVEEKIISESFFVIKGSIFKNVIHIITYKKKVSDGTTL